MPLPEDFSFETGFSEVPKAGAGLFTSPQLESEVTQSQELQGAPSSVAQFRLSRFSDAPAFAHWAVAGTGEVFYVTERGKVFSAEEGEDVEVSSQELPSPLRRALPSADGRLMLGLFGTPENPRWGLYDTIDTVWRPLPSSIEDAVFGAGNETLLVRRSEGSGLQLGTIDLRDGTFPFTPIIQDFRLKNVSLYALSPERILLLEAPLPGTPSRLWELNPKTLALRLLSGAEEGLLLNVSPTRDLLLKYANPDVFQILDSNFEEQAPLFFVTLPDKCGFEGQDIFCFRPQEDVTEQAAFFDDYMKKRTFTTDSFLLVGASDLGEDTLFVSGGSTEPPIDGIFPRFAKGRYTFINRYDGFVYQLAQ